MEGNPAAAPRPNRLVHEASLYLRQHAHQPVDWYPWGEEALERARREDRPIFLSVGYSACHWCHVMAHESFEDPAIAELLNRHFVCIKVDREERPDVDQVYQAVCQLLTGQGGWPLTVFLTPDLQPFYAGTYFPPAPRYGRPGLPQVAEACAKAYRERPDELRHHAGQITRALGELLRPLSIPPPEPGRAGEEAEPAAGSIPRAVDRVLQQADGLAGGFGRLPKFPQASTLELLLRAAWRFGHARAMTQLALTLRRMAQGGLFDQVGGGFHRYSVDRWWKVPHFEKMLYDNALLVPLYARVGQWRSPELTAVAHQTLDWMLREMQVEGGGFAASLDADSPGEDGRPGEGYYYRWRPVDLEAALPDREQRVEAAQALDILSGDEAADARLALALEQLAGDAPPGWLEEAPTVPGRLPRLPEAGEERTGGLTPEARSAMANHRAARRARPGRDEKVLLGWHALAISALTWGYRTAGEPQQARRYLKAALDGWDFVTERLTHPALGLLHAPATPDGRAVPAFCDDYAFAALAALDLFACTLDRRYLEWAERRAEEAFRQFHEDGAYFLSGTHHASPIGRSQDVWDQATPSPNAAMAAVHARLAALLDDPRHLERGRHVVEAAWPLMRQHVSGTAALWCALDRLDGGTSTLTAMTASVAAAREGLAGALRLPHPSLELRWEAAQGDGAYVLCTGTRCERPEANLKTLLARLRPALA
ncbi:thioredoxin domain-containing protein [Carboxydochorda subterranea]|uniref:Thioredoxin domain-containing protein n=1 Tax=Carboxydichorda subterranea TaxID=3109565 RepID=A0ABZ1BXF3_9FIRM|nr:thioredoxin domain-containing protein [Limnochorda sp. L945t]WRP17221.1 thioredoxin domain-containing protein [Limnochorda sp. L945t]